MSHEAGFETANSALDEVFERYGPVDMDAFIDAQFNEALRGEEEMFSSIYDETPATETKMAVQDGCASAVTLNTFEFSYGSDTQLNLDRTIPLSPQEGLQSSGPICTRCRENMEKDDYKSCIALHSKTTTTREAQRTKGCAGGIELKVHVETTMDTRNTVVTELQLADISDDVGTCWRELGPKLKIAASKIHNLDEEYRSNRDKANALLIQWKQQEASGATVGHLSDVLKSIGRKSIAEKLLGENKAPLPTVTEGEEISLTVKCNLNAEPDNKLMLCEDAHGNKFIMKAINNSKGHWNFEEIQKNKHFLETVAVAAQDIGKSAEQRRQESLKRISSEVQELRQQLKRVKLDCSDGETSSGISDPKENTQSSKELLNDTKVPPQDATHLLHSCEEQRTFCQGIYNALIKLIGEVGQPRNDNFMCIKQLCDFTKELKVQEKTFFPKIGQLHDLKQHLDELQVAQVEELEKWSRAQKEQVEGVEKLLSSLLNQGKIEKHQKLLKRRSEPVMGVKPSHAFGRRRSKTDSSKSSSKSQSLIELPDGKKCNISGPLCVQRMCLIDTDKKLKNEKS